MPNYGVEQWIDGWMGGWVGGWMDGWMKGRMDGWMGGWTDGWMDGQMTGCPTYQLHATKSLGLILVQCSQNAENLEDNSYGYTKSKLDRSQRIIHSNIFIL